MTQPVDMPKDEPDPPPVAWPPPPAEQVVCVRCIPRTVLHWNFEVIIAVSTVIVMFIVVAGLMASLTERMKLGRGAGIIVSMIPVIACFLYLCRRFSREARAMKALPARQLTPGRLMFVGDPHRLNQCGPLLDTPFEPQVFRASPTMSDRRTMLRAMLLLWPPLLALVIAVKCTLPLFGMKFPWHANIQNEAGAALLLVILGVSWRYPTYFRVVPGRLDVMRFDAFRNRVLDVTLFDLRRAGIIACMYQLTAFAHIEGPGLKKQIEMFLMRDRDRFAYYLFLAALSTHQPPPLSDEELVG